MENQNNNDEKKKTTDKIGNLLFVGCLFIGMAAGYYFGKIAMGLFAGMGIGFILRAVVIASERNE